MAGALDKRLPKVATNLLKRLGGTPISIEIMTYTYDLNTGNTVGQADYKYTTGYIATPTFQEIAGSNGLITDTTKKVFVPALDLPFIRVKDKLYFDNVYHDVIKVEIIKSGEKSALQISWVKECENVNYAI
jgi:hypothetical protein